MDGDTGRDGGRVSWKNVACMAAVALFGWLLVATVREHVAMDAALTGVCDRAAVRRASIGESAGPDEVRAALAEAEADLDRAVALAMQKLPEE